MLKATFLAALAAAALAGAPGYAHGPDDQTGHSDGYVTAQDIATSGMDVPATSFELGDLTIAAPFSRATLPNAPVAGGFMTVTNNGTGDDRLIAASSEIAGVTEIHEMAMEGDVMKMRALPDGLSIPAGETVDLKPGGYHVMLMQLKAPLVEGDSVDVTLVFEKAGEITVPLSIKAFNARAATDDAGTADAHAGH